MTLFDSYKSSSQRWRCSVRYMPCILVSNINRFVVNYLSQNSWYKLYEGMRKHVRSHTANNSVAKSHRKLIYDNNARMSNVTAIVHPR